MLIISERLANLINAELQVKVKHQETTLKADVRIDIYQPHYDYTNKNYEYLEISNPSWGNFFDIRDGKVTYHAGEQKLNPEGKWLKEGRQVAKTSKFLRHITTSFPVLMYPMYEGAEYEKIINRFIEILASSLSVGTPDIKVSDDPGSIYQMDTSKISSGTLGSSCMRPESTYGCNEFPQFYNLVGAKVAYMTDVCGHLQARALLWEDVHSDDSEFSGNFTFVDRIYGTEQAIEAFKTWAHKKGYAHKVDQSHHAPELIFPDGTRIEDYHIERNWEGEPDGAPYVDTLMYYYDYTSRFRLASYGDGIELTCCDGHPFSTCTCYECGCHIDEDNEYVARIDGDTYCDSCAVYSDYHNDDILRHDAVYSSGYNTYILRDESVYVENMQTYYHEEDDDIVYVDGSYYHIDGGMITYCDHCGSYKLNSEINYYLEVRENLCDDCVESRMEEEGFVNVDGEWVEAEEVEAN